MATRSNTIKLDKEIDFETLIMDALSSVPNFNVSVTGTTAKCDEISAPTVGMGFNKWTRGRAYTTITYDKKSSIEIETTISGFTGAIYNGKYAQEVCDSLTSRIQNQIKKNSIQAQNNIPSVADELLKFKQLLDAGVITQEEFDKKKKELLNL